MRVLLLFAGTLFFVAPATGQAQTGEIKLSPGMTVTLEPQQRATVICEAGSVPAGRSCLIMDDNCSATHRYSLYMSGSRYGTSCLTLEMARELYEALRTTGQCR